MTACLTGYTLADLARLERSSVTCAHFFQRAPAMNPDRALITDKVCGVRVWDLLIRDIRYLGKLVEFGPTKEITEHAKHPYTQGLLKAVPSVHDRTKGELSSIPGTPPDLIAPPSGCAFAARCPYAMKICEKMQPEFTNFEESGHYAACWLHSEAYRAAKKEAE